MLRPLFISHGAPSLPLEAAPARDFLAGLPASMASPQAILVISAHWECDQPSVTALERNATLHDFGGFPRELYEMTYPAPGDPHLAERVVERLAAAGMSARVERRRGLDHGAWSPLTIAWPRADVPVVQLSLLRGLGPAHHLDLGRAMAPLTREGVLVLASGGFTHDLSSWRASAGLEEPSWVRAFADWFNEALLEGRVEDLLDYRRLAPFAARNHPTEEHLLPLFAALGAAGPQARAERLHASVSYGVLRMDAYAFGGGPSQMINEGDIR